MSFFSVVLKIVVFSLIFILSCENTVSVHDKDIPDGDADEVSDEDAAEKEPLFNLKVETNENNVLSCRLTFSTAEERKTFVKYFAANHAGYKIAEEEAKKDHYFFLWGMRENLDYKIEVYSDETEPELLATAEFHSGKVPESVLKPYLVSNDKELVQPGFVLLSQLADPDTVEMPPVIFMVDTDGFVVWYFEHYLAGYSLLSDPDYREETKTIFTGVQKGLSMVEIPAEEGLEIDLEGNILWKSKDIASCYYHEKGWHHNYRLLDDGTILFIQPVYREKLITDRIVNVDRDYNELWSWGYLDSPDYFDDITCSEEYSEWCDWTHTNTAFTDPEKRFLYFNPRRVGFFKMDMKTKEVLWKFGKDGDFTMLSEHEFPWPLYPHSPKIRDDGKALLFYDNGWNERSYSRVIEYLFDEDAMTAEISFEFDASQLGRMWFAPAYGDADYLENGNIFVTKGMATSPENSSLFEITRDGRIVWELYTQQNDEFSVEVFNSEKFVPPLEFLKEESAANLKVEENKENSLSCRLTFSTPEERKTFVKYYSDTHKGYEIREDSAKKEHYFFLWGMRENRDYKIEIYSDEEKPELIATTEFHSGNTPDYLPGMYLGEHNAGKTAEGFVLFQYAATSYDHIFPVAVMVDNDGEVVWYYEYDPWYASSFGDVSWNPEKQTILIALTKDSSAADSLAEEAIEIDLEGSIVWMSPGIMSYYYGPGSWNHAYYMMKDGSVTFPQVIYDGCIVTDRIVNLDADSYSELWSWDYRNYFEKPDCSTNTGGDFYIDWTHTNSVSMFKEEGIVYVNSRNFSTFFKIDMRTGVIIWRLGRDGDFTFVGDSENPWFEFAHEPEINGVNGNKIILFDNGSAERGFSRIAEYTIDETDMTAEMTFEFDGRETGKGWWSEYWGDADRLENGNIFVTAGFYDMQQISRFFEVTREGEIVWELFFEKADDWQISLYKADKFVPPLEFIK